MPANPYKKRFFSETSFWNTPLEKEIPTCRKNEYYINLLLEHSGRSGLNINIDKWTIPVYYAQPDTPLRFIRPKITRCFLSQGHYLASKPYLTDDHPQGIHPSVSGGVPIPSGAQPDAEWDAHISIVDPSREKIYDLWQASPLDGDIWESNSAICYDLNGEGVFNPLDFEHVHNDESIHYYGPCRASGVPAVAGLIMHHEINSGCINHKLAFACSCGGLQEFIAPPAVWTDGWMPGGIPEGIILQLDPALDLNAFSLSPAALAIARALQEYGAVLVDNCDGATLYAEGLTTPGFTWDSILEKGAVGGIGFENFRFIELGKTYAKGSHPVYHNGLSLKYYDYLKQHESNAVKTP